MAERHPCARCGSDELSPHLLVHKFDSHWYNGQLEYNSPAVSISYQDRHFICKRCKGAFNKFMRGSSLNRFQRWYRAFTAWRRETRTP